MFFFFGECFCILRTFKVSYDIQLGVVAESVAKRISYGFLMTLFGIVLSAKRQKNISVFTEFVLFQLFL